MGTLYFWDGTAEMTTSDMRRQSSSVVEAGSGVMMWCGLNLELESAGAGAVGEMAAVGPGVVESLGEEGAGTEGRLENSTMADSVSWSHGCGTP